MYDIRQFKPALYALVLLGIAGYALAAESPALWVVATGAILLNMWLVKTGRFTPMPRIVANIVTVLTLLFVLVQARTMESPIFAIGQFLVLLQLIKLYEQRANRDYAQLLILSLLLIVAASINTASLVFGILLIVYLFLSLYCCLLFHLKVETDQAKAALAVPEEKISPMTLRQDQRHLSRSMRRLTGAVSTVAITMAVFVFLFFPRGTGAGMFQPIEFRPSQTLTGFSEQVSFQNIAKITQSEQVVAHVTLLKNEETVRSGQTLLLRGITVDTYGGEEGIGGPWRWARSPVIDEYSRELTAGGWTILQPPADTDIYRQKVSLRPTGTSVLFAMPGPTAIRINRDVRLRYSARDESLALAESIVRPLEYEVTSIDRLGSAAPLQRPMSSIHPRIQEYAMREEVTDGLAAQRGGNSEPHALDAQIAENIQNHLRSQFTYTLDLTDARRIMQGQDPIVAFLYDLERGHCEYFAGAMTLMCQSLGMNARMVLGFKSDEFNDVGDYYIVRQSHAHAWVEVLTPDGWKTYDPTSGRDAIQAAKAGPLQSLRHLFDFLEYKWANNVVAYDQSNRENLIGNVERKITNSAISGHLMFLGLRDWFNKVNFWFVSSSLLGGLIALMVVALLAAVAWYLWERWRLYRKAARIGLDALPTSDQIRLVRQLGFYDDLMRLLERHEIARPRHMTPMEFSNSLTFLPVEAFQTIQRLTDLFYRIRFGNTRLRSAHHRRLNTVVGRVGASLSDIQSRG